MAQTIIGLDIGSWAVKAVVVESTLRKTQLTGFHSHHLPGDASGGALEGGVEAAVAATVHATGGEMITAAVPGAWVLTREVTLPFSDDKRIQSVLGFQLESTLPLPLADMVYDYQLLRTDEDGSHLLCSVIDRKRLEEWLATVKAGGADPRYVTATSLAVGLLLPHLEVQTAGRTVALVDMGHRSTNVTLVRDGRVDGVRTIARGGHQLTAALAAGLELDYAEAEAVKHDGVRFDGYVPPGTSDSEHSQRARLVARALEPLLREVRVTIHAYTERTGHAVEGVELFGGTSQLPGVDALLARVLDVEVRRPQPTGELWQTMPATDLVALGLPALALALRNVADSSKHRVNFRQGDNAFTSDFGLLREKAVWIGVFVVLLAALFFGRQYFRVGLLESQEARLAAQLDGFSTDLFGEPFAGKEPIDRFELAKLAVETPPSADESLYPAMTAFKVLFDLSELQASFNGITVAEDGEHEEFNDPEADPEEEPEPGVHDAGAGHGGADQKKQIELDSVNIDVKGTSSDAQTATISGTGPDVVTIEGFRRKLAEHPCFRKVEQQGDTKNSNKRPDWKEFTLKIDIRCAKPEEAAAGVAEAGDKKTTEESK